MRWLPLLGAVVFGAPVARPLEAQQAAARFEIVWVGDSTFSFPVGDSEWVSRGLRGIAVDPGRRDVLLARFRVLSVARGQAIALVTGQTTRLTTEHVALVERPAVPWHRQPTFWGGAVAGGLAGLVLGILVAN